MRILRSAAAGAVAGMAGGGVTALGLAVVLAVFFVVTGDIDTAIFSGLWIGFVGGLIGTVVGAIVGTVLGAILGALRNEDNAPLITATLLVIASIGLYSNAAESRPTTGGLIAVFGAGVALSAIGWNAGRLYRRLLRPTQPTDWSAHQFDDVVPGEVLA